MASLFFSLFNCCKSKSKKRLKIEPTTVSGIPDDPVAAIIITTEPEKEEDGRLTDESDLPKYNNDGFESEDEEEETDSETEEQDYRQFSGTKNDVSEDEREKMDTVAEIVIPPSTSDSIDLKSDYDKLLYSNATAQILMDLEISD
uniref:Uncharacterized protein n=1 Tax=Panagrolaimus superbus TaxID=310955 RepID=A0A914YDT4_9BILA